MTLKTFDPHREEFTCNYEKSAEPALNQEAEAWFRKGLALTSFDLWPDDREFSKAAALWSKASEKGHWQATLNLASLYISGNGVVKDTERAVQLVEEAIPDGFVLPDEPQGGHLVQHLHTDAVMGGYWLAQLRKPVTPRQVAWNAAQVPMRYEIGEAFDKTPEGLTKDDGVFRFHYLGTPVPQAPEAKYAPDWRVPQGVMREVPVPARELHSTGLLPAPATGIWHGSVDPGHPLAKVFNQWYRQSYVEEGQAFPDPRDRGLDISPKDIQWRWLDQANRPQPSGRKEITIRNFSQVETTQTNS
ncbi:TPR repeat containing, SEL1 subfamily protein [Herbaspirillum frisingense GSF30]|uniref:TPR repeat containing, SEL1 subfamily protein n=2 Tax=Herbaspirillum frisingense TaxID=92645 RepID=A0AAI9IDD5_9BURK|nr:TPR repeat containing, SEL1 subfamily protein [Herbaspirillum frisingense GSF30]